MEAQGLNERVSQGWPVCGQSAGHNWVLGVGRPWLASVPASLQGTGGSETKVPQAGRCGQKCQERRV